MKSVFIVEPSVVSLCALRKNLLKLNWKIPSCNFGKIFFPVSKASTLVELLGGFKIQASHQTEQSFNRTNHLLSLLH